ncbi:MAG TPA: PQQ-binding-like beta-propeller repeat protein, partial [Gemmatimonadales bacterium]|nr:PQQ-binding-like beta-propeller repeat protein [Gemmatimonadales bacterium]
MLWGMVNAACTGYRPVPEFDPGNVAEPSPVEGTPLTRLWRSRPVRGPFAPLASDTTNAYLAGADRRVVAVGLTTGRTRWAVRLPGPPVGGVLLAGDAVFAATDQPGGKLYALKRESGAELWSRKTGYVQAPIALADGRIIALTRRGEILA